MQRGSTYSLQSAVKEYFDFCFIFEISTHKSREYQFDALGTINIIIKGYTTMTMLWKMLKQVIDTIKTQGAIYIDVILQFTSLSSSFDSLEKNILIN